jgi:predicted kinase
MNDGELIVLCGWAVAGKDTLAAAIAKQLNIHWLDIDAVRVLNFGTPNPHPVSQQEMEKDRREMKGAYDLFYSSITANMAMGRRLIVTATFSRTSYWDNFLEILIAARLSPNLRVIWCKPENDSDEEIARRLASRQFGVNCWSSVNSLERYHEVKARFEIPPVEHLTLDTSPPNTVENCVDEAIKYILS